MIHHLLLSTMISRFQITINSLYFKEGTWLYIQVAVHLAYGNQ